MANIKWDTSDFQSKAQGLVHKIKKQSLDALGEVADEVLRLSAFEVPIGETTRLQNSGHTEPQGDDYLVGYNTEYAAYQHEGRRFDGSHVIRRHSNPRSKTKYLEDPVKNNLSILLKYYNDAIKRIF